MAMDFSAWATPASAAIQLHLTRDTGEDVFDAPFHPEHTEFLFEADTIIGYKAPRIDLAFRAHDMRLTLRCSHEQKIKPDAPNIAKLMDLRAALSPYVAPEAFERGADDKEKEDAAQWAPPGKRLASYAADGHRFEVWCSSLSDRKAMAIMKNMKILIPMFIETGTIDFLADDDVPENAWTIDRWTLFLLHRVDDFGYSLVGFATSYRLWVWPAEPKSDPHTGELMESSRERISQFVILPPYRRHCHGIQLYNAVTSKFLSDPRVFEITVEDPNVRFDRLRDNCDLARLYRDPAFANLQIPSEIPDEHFERKRPVPVDAIVGPTLIKTLCQRHKLIPRQVQRLVELHLLRQIPAGNRSETLVRFQKMRARKPEDRQYYLWRLLVKARVFVRNYEELQEVEETERVPKLEQAVDSLQEEYDELTEGFLARVDLGYLNAPLGRHAAAAGRTTDAANGASRKKRVIEDDSETEGQLTPKRQATEPLEGAQ
jgi:histone acetyltransferase 1